MAKSQSIFHVDKLSNWDKWTIGLYLFVSLVCYLIFLTSSIENSKTKILIFYPVATQLFLYLLNYKSLRNFKVYTFWLGIGIVHLVIFFYLINHFSGLGISKNTIFGFRNTLPLLLIFQILQLASLKFQRKELVCPSRGGSPDIFDNRKITIWDTLLFFIYIGSFFVLNYLHYF
jgi:hypothetical protein